MSDLTERLLAAEADAAEFEQLWSARVKEADVMHERIQSLEAELDRVRGALENIAGDEEPELGNRNTNDLLARMYWNYARQALAPGEE
jgi:hypothetical protein